MQVKSTTILCGFVCALLTLSQLEAQQPASKRPEAEIQDVVRVETSLVTLPVKVSRRGKVVHGLRRDQFHIFENGVEQEIAYFEPPTTSNTSEENVQPLAVALMLDVSDSTEFQLSRIQDAALGFLHLLRSEDRVLVVAFDKHVSALTDLTNDREALRRAINQLKTGGGTSLYAALDQVINEAFVNVTGRKAIVLLTDGVDTTSKTSTYDSTIRAAQTSDVAIFPIQYHTYSDFSDNPSRESSTLGAFGTVAHVTKRGEFASEAYKRATLYLRLLADKTSGQFQFADSAKNLARSFGIIAQELREQYTLGYYPKDKSPSQRKLEVQVAAPKVDVRTRKSYVYRHQTR